MSNFHNPTLQMESPGKACFEGVYPPISRQACAANILTSNTITSLVNHWQDKGRLTEISLETGGGDASGNRFPSVTAKVSRYAGGQVHPRVDGPEWAEILAHYTSAARLDPGVIVPVDSNKFNINVSQVLWRHNHRTTEGDCRMVPITVEISHCAESYHNGSCIAGFANGWKVEVSELETAPMNESRKLCSMYRLMWRKAGTGALVSAAEKTTYAGPTCCIHQTLGRPCYAPFPASEGRKPTGKTPSKRKKRERRSGGSSEKAAKKLAV